MTFDPSVHHRRSIRWAGHDYRLAGSYFVTACAHQRTCLFGKITAGEMNLNGLGRIVLEERLRTPLWRPEATLAEFVIMPNHLHGVIVLADTRPVGATRWVAHPSAGVHKNRATDPVAPTTRGPHGPAAKSIAAILAQFKSVSTKRINRQRGTPGAPVWQRNYFEHVVRSEEEFGRIRQYILDNPLCWELDRENPQHSGAPSNAGTEPWQA